MIVLLGNIMECIYVMGVVVFIKECFDEWSFGCVKVRDIVWWIKVVVMIVKFVGLRNVLRLV